ncbi:riboflavin synthase, alpha subunit [Allomyces macrogynus ATCC 38327]|uniref:Riboflavin synthase n=1 Tax=Allomyces macrogynus (strain ATCC 38327) TaxID=578462 RepID=A0A0L0SE08_ALLM3|nr:riboflavin synthase, alpha subunit [Allomyces macrogynus ATCC 38327]|eukprot:KNE60716.1 riboflavin synthase, alpha subunit [Allomyces macrogynus ATCC 38327]
MFTGIVEIMGHVAEIIEHDTDGGWTMTIGGAEAILGDCHLGDSIAVNGTCLTVTAFTESTFKRTNLGKLQVGAKVNLERAMDLAHAGHVDGTATISKITPDVNSLRFEFTLPDRSLLPYLIPKGYVALDGTSLTVCDVNDTARTFTIMLVAYTQEHVVMPLKKVGDTVNVEVDMLGKYVERVVVGMLGSAPEAEETATEGSKPSLGNLLQAHIERAVAKELAKRS